MFTELKASLSRPMAAPQKNMGSILSSLGNIAPEPVVERGGISGFMRQARQPGGFFERLNLFGAELQDIDDGGNRAQTIAARRAAEARAEQEARAQSMLAAALGGGGGMAGAGQPGQGGAPNLRDAAPGLLQAALAGANITPYVSLLEATQPEVRVENGVAYDPRTTAPGSRIGVNLTNVNGFQIDPNDPTNTGRYLPDLPEGQTPLYDDRGNVVATRNLDGSVEALAQREAAVAGARSQATAPYEFVNVPTSTGASAVVSRQQAAGGVFVGQNPAEAIIQEGAARAEAERSAGVQARASSAATQLPILDEMERRLPNVIAGFGAGARLQAARARAALGDDRARQQVEDTEIFVNQARNIVASVIRNFGSNPTEGERNYAERMSGADVELSPDTLAEGIRLARERIYRELAAADRPAPQSNSRRTPPPPPGFVLD